MSLVKYMGSKIITIEIDVKNDMKKSYDYIVKKFEVVTELNLWKAYSEQLLKGEMSPSLDGVDFKNAFQQYWINSAHHIRRQINDDNSLSQLIALFLPKYIGEDIVLYRGENLDAYNDNKIGFCWTPNVDKATQFMSSNDFGSGGVLLRCNCQADWILSSLSLNEHSVQLGENEYVVNPFFLKNVEILDRLNR